MLFGAIMSFVPPNPLFTAKPTHAALGWGVPTAPTETPKPSWHSDIAKKKAFGEALGKVSAPFDAAQSIFPNVSEAVWAVQNWLRDPIVLEAREFVENNVKQLDKDAFLAKVLRIADEKTATGLPAHETKDRIALLRLYAEVQKFVGKVDIDLSNKTFFNNAMQITLVEPTPEIQAKTVEHRPTELKSLDNALEIDLKLVG